MITNKQKVLMLLTSLGALNEAVLDKLSPELSERLRLELGSELNFRPQDMNDLFEEILLKVETAREQQSNISNNDSFKNIDLVEDESEVEAVVANQEDLSFYNTIAKELSEQKPQIVAFFISRLEADHKEKLLQALDPELRIKVENTKVEMSPISEKIHNVLYQKFFSNSN